MEALRCLLKEQGYPVGRSVSDEAQQPPPCRGLVAAGSRLQGHHDVAAQALDGAALAGRPSGAEDRLGRRGRLPPAAGAQRGRHTPRLAVTGVFDATTDAAVRTWQQQAGLPVTGVVAPRRLETAAEPGGDRTACSPLPPRVGASQSDGLAPPGTGDSRRLGPACESSGASGRRGGVEQAGEEAEPVGAGTGEVLDGVLGVRHQADDVAALVGDAGDVALGAVGVADSIAPPPGPPPRAGRGWSRRRRTRPRRS